mmetsp:Transcript_68977/g.211611  ORF Transcript_68977/g.211611 Transcript_68977/m.211611 type:complete len:334 (+) Transcript_68977:90-1091(+)
MALQACGASPLAHPLKSCQLRSAVLERRRNNGLVVATHVHGQTELGPLLDLVIAALPLHLAVNLVDLLHPCGAHRVAEGKQAAAGVHGQLPVQVRDAILANRGALAVLREADGLVHQQLCDGEAIVHLRDAEVRDLDARLLVHPRDDGLGGVHHREVGRVLVEVAATPIALQDLHARGLIDARLFQTLLVGKHYGRGAVGHLAAIRQSAIRGELRVRQKVRVLVRNLGLARVDLHRRHVRVRVLVAIGVRLLHNRAQIINREVLEPIGVVLGTPRQQARESEVVDGGLPREVRGPREEKAAVPRRNRRLLLCARDQREVAAAAAQRVDGRRDR